MNLGLTFERGTFTVFFGFKFLPQYMEIRKVVREVHKYLFIIKFNPKVLKKKFLEEKRHTFVFERQNLALSPSLK